MFNNQQVVDQIRRLVRRPEAPGIRLPEEVEVVAEIRHLMGEHRLTDLAKATGIAVSTISRISRNMLNLPHKKGYRYATLCRLLAYLQENRTKGETHTNDTDNTREDDRAPTQGSENGHPAPSGRG